VRRVNTRERSSGAGKPPEQGEPAPSSETAKPERIAKRMARAGLCSRREAETWIAAGRVKLNGKVLATPAVTVTEKDKIEVDGNPLQGRERTRLWLFHKPGGLVTTADRPEGRPTVFGALPDDLPRVLSVGRLDINTEGLLLLTNDGGLSRVLELPSTGWLRRYRVRAHGQITQAQLDTLKEGVAVNGVLYGPIEALIDREQGGNVWLTLAFREGKNREVKEVLGSLGLEVNRLIRVSYGPFQLGDLRPGEVREVRGRTLREQLGEKLIAEANADFDAPILNQTSSVQRGMGETKKPAAKPRREKAVRGQVKNETLDRLTTRLETEKKPPKRHGKPKTGAFKSGNPKTGNPKSGTQGADGKFEGNRPHKGGTGRAAPRGGKR